MFIYKKYKLEQTNITHVPIYQRPKKMRIRENIAKKKLNEVGFELEQRLKI